MYIDVYCFRRYKMEELYTIAVSFGKIVHNRGFSPSKCYPKITHPFVRAEAVLRQYPLFSEVKIYYGTDNLKDIQTS